MTDQPPTVVSKFPLGQVLVTAGISVFMEHGLDPLAYVRRHAQQDWGDLGADDRRANEDALIDGERLLSAYNLTEGQRFQFEQLGLDVPNKIYVITESNREITTVLRSDEY